VKCYGDSLLVGSDLCPGYLPFSQAARWAGISERTLKRWIGKGLPKYQAGPREKILIKPEDIHRFLTKKVEPQVDLDSLVEEVLQDMKET
jgi:predicted site-specific integrase-resolvase